MPIRYRSFILISLLLVVAQPTLAEELVPLEPGPYPVATTNMAVADEYMQLSGPEMEVYLRGKRSLFGDKYVADILKYPEAAWLVDVAVPDLPELYGPFRGKTLPVLSFVTYPSQPITESAPYEFPYHDSAYGSFQHMLAPGENPKLADSEAPFPLVILSHGASAHGIYDIAHANNIASHGYIVAVVQHGDNRTQSWFGDGSQTSFLRALVTKSVIDSIVDSDEFGAHVDADNVAVSGHSFGGFTALAVAGAQINGHPASPTDSRVKATILAAPWVGRVGTENTQYPFGMSNEKLRDVTAATISFVATEDTITTPESIYPAMQLLNGPTYVIDLVDQPHNFGDGSWADRNNWEILFLNAFLKNDTDAMQQLQRGSSMRGNNVDVQRFEYQRPPDQMIVADLYDKYHKGWLTNDDRVPDAIMSLMSDDVVLMPDDGGDIVSGKDNIANWWFPDGQVVGSVEIFNHSDTVIEIDGNIAVARGRFNLSFTIDGAVTTTSGNQMISARKTGDDWKITAITWNSKPAN